jgi:hypothetical protein
MKLHKRLEALEKHVISEPTILSMPDGSSAAITGQGDYLLRLLGAAFGGENIGPEQSTHLDLIRRSTGAKEAAGAHLTDLIRCLLHGPAEEVV